MSDKILRAKLIRLAHANPELRKDLLPLLKQAASMEVGKVYMITKPSSDMEGVWFKAESEQKNGGMKGQGVEWWSGKKNPDKPKQYSVQKANYNLWKPATDVPSEVKLAKTATDPKELPKEFKRAAQRWKLAERAMAKANALAKRFDRQTGYHGHAKPEELTATIEGINESVSVLQHLAYDAQQQVLTYYKGDYPNHPYNLGERTIFENTTKISGLLKENVSIDSRQGFSAAFEIRVAVKKAQEFANYIEVLMRMMTRNP